MDVGSEAPEAEVVVTVETGEVVVSHTCEECGSVLKSKDSYRYYLLNYDL